VDRRAERTNNPDDWGYLNMSLKNKVICKILTIKGDLTYNELWELILMKIEDKHIVINTENTIPTTLIEVYKDIWKNKGKARE